MSGHNPFASDWLRASQDPRLRPPGTSSYVSGRTDARLWHRTIDQLLDRATARFGAGEAAVFCQGRQRLSWHDLRQQSDDVAAGLLCLGVRRGDRVGIWAPNRVEWLLAQFATARIGAILVNINPAYRVGELEHALRHVEVSVLLMAQRHKASDYVGMIRALVPEIDRAGASGDLHAARLPALRHVVVLDEAGARGGQPARSLTWASLRAMAGPAQRARLQGLASEQDPDESINIQFTSGTTGAPKGATLTHRNIVNNARFCAEAMALTPKDRLCIPVPLYHCFGMVLGVLACASSGATMVFPSEGFDAGATLRALRAERCTALHGVPTMFTALLELLPPEETGAGFHLRTGVMAGAPCPVDTMRQVIQRLGMAQVTIAYGMTETGPISFQSDVNDPLERRVTTVGRVHPHLEVKIVDAQGRTVPVGQRGELCVRGYSVMRGYWGDEVHTREAIDERGWMHTGDLATIDAEGYCNIVGRSKDMVIRGGENIFPAEVEHHLRGHPAVVDVQVFGVPDPKYGEELCAWVVAREGSGLTAEALREHCRGRIAHYKVPRHVKLVDAFPLTATGKAQKFAMRAAMAAELGLREQVTA